MTRTIVALALLVLVTAALQIGGAMLLTGTPGAACGACHN